MEEAAPGLDVDALRGTPDQGQHRRRGQSSTRRSASSRWSAIFGLAARGEWSSELRRQMIDQDLELSVLDQCRLLGLARSHDLLLRARRRGERGEPGPHSQDRPALPRPPRERPAHDGGGPEASRRRRQLQTGPALDADHGHQKPWSATKDDDTCLGPPCLSLPTSRRRDRPTEPGVGRPTSCATRRS